MLFPSTRADIAAEVLAMTGGSETIFARVDELSSGTGADQQLALHLVDFVIFAGGEHAAEAHARKADLLDARAAGEQSFVAHNVLKSTAVIERKKATD